MALSRCTVLDFSKLLPGPFCTMLLARMGMRVIRVELPHWPDALRTHGPELEGHGFIYTMVNRGKESLCLDYRKPAGLKALKRVIAKADALVEGFRPGTMEKMGLGAAPMRRLNPRLVYLSLTGYGQSGPKARRAGHDINFLAESGFLGAGDSNGAISFPSTQVADLAGATTAAMSLLGALLERGPRGRGRHLDVAMDAVMRDWMVLPAGWTRATGKEFLPGTQWFSGRDPFYRLYATRDGRRLAVGALEPQFHRNLLRELGREDLAGKPPAAVERALERLFASKPLSFWSRRLAGKDVCVSPVLTVREAARGRRPRGKAPKLGAHNKETLRSFGIGASEISRLEKTGILRS